jgi:hypothetical protein
MTSQLASTRPSHYSDVQRLQRLQQQQQHLPTNGGLYPFVDTSPCVDDGGTTPQARVKAPKKKKKVSKREVIPAGIDVYPFAQEFVNWACAQGGWWAIVGIITVLIGVVPWWALNWIPVIPPALMRYGVIQYILLVPVYLFNLIVFATSRMTEFYQLALIINALALADEIWLTVVLTYNFVACITGLYPSTCTGNYFIDILMSLPTVVLLIVGFATIAKILFVLAHSSGTSPLYFRLINH